MTQEPVPAVPKVRHVVRALILDPQDHVLLVGLHWDGLTTADAFWTSPGGSIQSGETPLATLSRAVREQTGLVVERLGPEVWTKTIRFRTEQWDGQVDHIHLQRCDRIDFHPPESPAQHPEIRWWSPEELVSRVAVFAPESLPQLMDRLRREGVPSSPLQLDGF